MVKAVKITTEDKISIVELPSWRYEDQAKEIGAKYTETVKTQIMRDMFQKMICMIVDESGAVNDRDVNAAASILYGVQNHGYAIHGDILFGLQCGPDILPVEDPEKLMEILLDKFHFLKK